MPWTSEKLACDACLTLLSRVPLIHCPHIINRLTLATYTEVPIVFAPISIVSSIDFSYQVAIAVL